MSIFCLGDLLLDVIVRLEQPLAHAAPTRTSRIVLRPGGQAANVAAWVAALGAQRAVRRQAGADDAGAIAARDRAARRRAARAASSRAGNGVVVSLVDPTGERTMRSDRGVAVELRPDEIDAAWFAACDRLHVSGYALCASRSRRRDAGRSRHARAARRARQRRLSSSWSAIATFGAERFRAAARAARARTSSSRTRTSETSSARSDRRHCVVVKLGARGAVVAGEARLPGVPGGAIVDTTGAGDALAAGFLVGGAELALEAAARCVAASPGRCRGDRPASGSSVMHD